jgi:2-polyprenyl-3-methyl-5-hydroxy-6-metoxy-1,4-benzoquinol methylase
MLGAMDRQARFEQTCTGPASAVRARIWQQVYGPEYPSWADPFSYVSVTELRRFAGELYAAPGQCLVDAGCGRGGPGLWMAAVTGARLIGIDPDEAALAGAGPARPGWPARPASAGELSATPGCPAARPRR